MQNFNNFISDLEKLILYKSEEDTPLENMPFGKGVHDALNFFLSLAESMGLKTKNYDNYMGEVYLGDGEEIGIIGHLDVVPAGTGWTTDPYTLTKIDDVYYGRGIADDKAPMLLCLYCLKELNDSNLPLKRKIRLFVGCDEESGWQDVAYFERNNSFPEYGFSPDGDFPVSYAEKGVVKVEFTIPKLKYFSDIKGGTVINAVCAYATAKASKEKIIPSLLQKHGLTVNDDTIISIGKSAHGSQPHLGKNAILPLFNYFLDCGEDLENVIDCLFKDKFGLSTIKNEQGLLTFSPNLISEENGKICIKADCRIPAPASLDDLLPKLDEFGIEYKTTLTHPPVMVKKDGWFVSTLLSAYNSVTGDKGQAISLCGSTFARVFKKGCAFGCEFPNKNNHIHEPNECISKNSLIDMYKIYKKAIFDLAVDDKN